MTKTIGNIANLHGTSKFGGATQSYLQIANQRFTTDKKLVGLQIPGSHLNTSRARIAFQTFFLLGLYLQIIVENNSLTVKHEIAEILILIENIEQFINSFDEANAKLLKRLVPFAIPVGVRNDNNV